MRTISAHRQKAAFSLVELLVVIAIVAIVGVMSFSVYAKVLASSNLNAASQSVVAALDQARQAAITRNSYVEVRIYELPVFSDSPASGTLAAYRGLQTFLVTNSGYTPLSKLLVLPSPLVFQTTPDLTHSSLLDSSQDSSLAVKAPAALAFAGPPVIAAPSLPNYQNNYAAVAFRMTAKGSLNLDATKQWFLTIVSSKDKTVSNNLPANYATIQLDGATGKALCFRP